METVKLFDAEWNLMEIVWETAPTTASRIAGIAGQRFGWAKNTTYTVLKRLISKGVLERSGTDFTVTPLVTRRQMQLVELNNLVEKRFGGSEAEMLEVLCRDGCPAPAHRQALVQVLEELR
ncbi:BlaI/MecI/CopY family transcriptional regulator [Candidatus Allofournierella excrementavium]|uniref:BlaI/MecI/CopY family transcriptional regulator n=1 Tax=Candidatus Allofournierella excrementavium TaxID=2838591 RepID=UPI0015B12AD2